MTDKNGIEMKTGDIVEITGAYFKNDNGLYFVERSPGDPSWEGRDYSLRRISKRGKISTAKNNLCFWPICVFVSDRFKGAEATEWNKSHAQIEVKGVSDLTELIAHFQEEANSLNERIKWTRWNFGDDHPEVGQLRAIQDHFQSVAQRLAHRSGLHQNAREFNALMRDLEAKGYHSGGYDFALRKTAIFGGTYPNSYLAGYITRENVFEPVERGA